MKKLVWGFLLAAAAGVILWGVLRKNEPPRVSFTRVKRQTLVSTLPTNGKAEPVEWQAIRAEAAGVVSRIAIQDGQEVAKGQTIATISDPSLQADIESAEAKVAEARAGVAAAEAGAKPAERAEIDNSLSRGRLDLELARKTLASLERLEQKQAATRQEVDAARDRVQQLQLEIAGLEKRRNSPAAAPDIAAARARVAEAESALALARNRAALATVRAPMAGVIYGRAVRQGSYVDTGELIANVGRMDELRVSVYVDEPELGRVEIGQPVTITWDALPGRQWDGRVERKPASIQALGSRQVGEVLVSIANRGRALVPGTNVNAEIRTAVVDNALVIPKETLRHDAQGDFVYALKGDTLERRAVKKGVSSITQVQLVEGLGDGDAVALPGDIALKTGDRVTPVM
ncbi:MAG: efflux RND transporter periplasmic adaptor subunit [Acidobacteria bacterium]|nr:efflux RND transporter periplasmic adaptor subunit [Acidobacteriota bacterium]